MNGLKTSQYDFTIILICIGILMFVGAMINAELKELDNKFKEGIISFLFILAYFALVWLISKYKEFDYMSYLVIAMGYGFILTRNIISFIIQRKNSKELIGKIKIKYKGIISRILLVVAILESVVINQQVSSFEVFFIIILLINLPLDYSVNRYLNLYKNGIQIGIFSFPKKIINYQEIIPYKNIEKLTLIEDQNNKFILNINFKKKSNYEYIISRVDKEEFIFIIKSYIQEDRIFINN